MCVDFSSKLISNECLNSQKAEKITANTHTKRHLWKSQGQKAYIIVLSVTSIWKPLYTACTYWWERSIYNVPAFLRAKKCKPEHNTIVIQILTDRVIWWLQWARWVVIICCMKEHKHKIVVNSIVFVCKKKKKNYLFCSSLSGNDLFLQFVIFLSLSVPLTTKDSDDEFWG